MGCRFVRGEMCRLELEVSLRKKHQESHHGVDMAVPRMACGRELRHLRHRKARVLTDFAGGSSEAERSSGSGFLPEVSLTGDHVPALSWFTHLVRKGPEYKISEDLGCLAFAVGSQMGLQDSFVPGARDAWHTADNYVEAGVTLRIQAAPHNPDGP